MTDTKHHILSQFNIYPTVSLPSGTVLSRVGANPVFLPQAYSSNCFQSAHFLGDLE